MPFIYELILPEQTHLLEFFYTAKNIWDFKNIDVSKASHWFEISDIKWIDINNPEIEFLPKALLPLLRESSKEDLQKTRTITIK